MIKGNNNITDAVHENKNIIKTAKSAFTETKCFCNYSSVYLSNLDIE